MCVLLIKGATWAVASKTPVGFPANKKNEHSKWTGKLHGLSLLERGVVEDKRMVWGGGTCVNSSDALQFIGLRLGLHNLQCTVFHKHFLQVQLDDGHFDIRLDYRKLQLNDSTILNSKRNFAGIVQKFGVLKAAADSIDVQMAERERENVNKNNVAILRKSAIQWRGKLTGRTAVDCLPVPRNPVLIDSQGVHHAIIQLPGSGRPHIH
mmetsp:Transcript_80421/g.134406  ORF Transcript_80421/g.134406 Transcript_80421/m.134406 type:complete len:208 (+) Transcript_80421:363-986(+)